MDCKKCEKRSTIKEISDFKDILRKDIQYQCHTCNQCACNINKTKEIKYKENRNNVIRILDFPDNKICTKCKIGKPIIKFRKILKRDDYVFYSECKECERKY